MLVPQAALAGTWYVCGQDRIARQSCCCPSETPSPERARPTAPEIRRAACCDVLSRGPREQVARVELASVRVPAPTPFATPAHAATLPDRALAVAAEPAARATAPPAPPEPIYLRHASLLL